MDRPAPSPYEIAREIPVDPENVGDAALGMEQFRAEAGRLEEAARQRLFVDIASAEQRRDEEALAAVEHQASAEQREAEEQMRAEMAAKHERSDSRKPMRRAIVAQAVTGHGRPTRSDGRAV